MKKCNICKELKSKDNYYINNPKTGALQSKCKSCHQDSPKILQKAIIYLDKDNA